MKPKRSFRTAIFASSALFAVTYTQAATLYWDGNATQTANADGGAGTWINGTTTNWDTRPFGGADSVWTDGAHTAHFGAVAGTVTIGTGGVTVGGLTFNTNNNSAYTLTAGTNGLNFSSGTNNITFATHNGNAAATISGLVGGPGANLVLNTQNLTRTAALTFSGISAGGWTGATTINQGTTLTTTTTSGNINRVLNSTSGITLNGGAIQFNRATNAGLNSIIDSAAITVNGGGTFGVTSADAGGASANETIGAVTVNSGQMNFNWTNGASSGAQMIMGASGSGNLVVNGTGAVTFSGNLGSTGRWKVTGAGTTTPGEIIGAYATTGAAGGIAAQTDYAVYSSDFVAAAGISSTAESTWSTDFTTGTGTLNNSMGVAGAPGQTLSASRNINSLRHAAAGSATANSTTEYFTLAGNTFSNGDIVGASGTGGLTAGTQYYVINKDGAGAGTFQLSTTPGGPAAVNLSNTTAGQIAGAFSLGASNLGTTGILNGTAAPLIINGSGGVVTLPTTTAGNLFVTTGAGTININAPIQNNTGALTVVKNGNNTLTLSSTSNTYSGGTVLNAGTLAIGNVNNIGGAGASLTFGGTATLAPSAALNFSSGTLTVNQGALATVANANAVTFATTTGAGTLTFSGSTSHNIGNASGLSGTLALLQASGTQSVQFSSLNGNTAGSLLAFGGNANDSNQRSNFLFIGSTPLEFTATGRQVAITPSTNSNGGARWNVLQNNSASGAGTPNTWVINSDLINTGVRSAVTLLLDGSNTDNNAFNGVIGDNTMNGGALWVGKNGAGKWILGGDNTFTGRLVVSQGTLSVGAFNNADTAGPLGQGLIQLGGTDRANGANTNGPYAGGNSGTLEYTGGAVTTTRTVIIGDNQAGNNGGGTIANNGTGAMTFSAANFNTAVAGITATRTLTLSGSYTAAANEIQGIIQDNVSSTGKVALTKTGNSTWVLGGDNTYTGATNVNQGSLIINGNSSTAVGAVTVAAAGTIGGIGTVGGATTLNGTLSPGESPGTLTFANNLTVNNGATYLFESGDLTNVNGTLDLNDNWTLTLSGLGFQDGGSVILFDYFALAATPDLVPTINLVGLGFTPSGGLTLTDNGSAIVLNGISAVPEPNVAALIGALGAILLLRRRR